MKLIILFFFVSAFIRIDLYGQEEVLQEKEEIQDTLRGKEIQDTLKEIEIKDTLKKIPDTLKQEKIPFYKKLGFGIGYSGRLFYTQRDIIPLMPLFPGTSLGKEPGYPHYWLNSIEGTSFYYINEKEILEMGVEYERVTLKNPPPLKENKNYFYKDIKWTVSIIPIFLNHIWEFKNGTLLKIGVIYYFCEGADIRDVYKVDSIDNLSYIGEVKIKGKGNAIGGMLEFGKLWNFNFWINEVAILVGVRGAGIHGIEYNSISYLYSENIDPSGFYVNFELKFQWRRR